MKTRKKHPNKAIEKAVEEAEKYGWVYEDSGRSAHAWGRLYCPLNAREGCAMSIWSTPKRSENHAKQILRRVKLCPHTRGKD